jgi:tetratricopeptide (TPR) repeat protein
MKVRSFHLISALAVAFLSLSTSASLAENKTDEFRGHKWGSSLESFGEMEQLHFEDAVIDVEEEPIVFSVYRKPGEKLTMGDVDVESIAYFFKDNQFIMAQVVFNSEENFKRLIKVLDSQYGRGVKKNYPDGGKLYEGLTGRKSPERNRYWWFLEEKNLSLYIEYFEKDEKGQIMYFYELDYQDEEQSVGDYYAYGKQGSNYIKQGKYDEAIESLTKAIDLNPEGDMAYNTRGWAYYKKKQIDLAISDYTKAIEINPSIELFYNNRGLAYLDSGQNDLAISDFTHAIEINPTGDTIYYYRGAAHTNKGEYDDAISDYSKAIELNQSYADAYNQLARIMATCPVEKGRDGIKAVELAEKAVALSPAPRVLDTLAAAYAEAGMFDNAIETQNKAILILLKESRPETEISGYKERLAAYQVKKPWRESTISANYTAVMDSLLGADINDVINMGSYPHRTLMTANGNQIYLSSGSYPHVTFTTTSGNQVYVYNYGTAFKTPAIPDGQTAYNVYGYDNKSAYYGGQTVGKWCTTFLEADMSGRIIKWRAEGSNCTEEAVTWRSRNAMPGEVESRVDEIIYERLIDGWRDAGYSEETIEIMLSEYKCRQVNCDPAKTKIYIDIMQPDQIFEFGKFKFAVNPGDKLEVLSSKVCRDGYGQCWEVRNVDTGETGYARVDMMKAYHRVFQMFK